MQTLGCDLHARYYFYTWPQNYQHLDATRFYFYFFTRTHLEDVLRKGAKYRLGGDGLYGIQIGHWD